ncbi:NAD(P)-dependent oxidoreductase [Paenibacillus sp. sptzw28]|uniref:NAD-dependent epimerase/dehydratase family protein n=1 Tax=Paenibacillus sp. sptzw28 TaxID=715179 RepID=UPI001C6E8F1D|nr:NAD(P)-dependent oxidoreductase [Paenibacillus sp. sptzw28]QYR19408.1 NAD(P)-dependent oxidoreductase [Paenibacillus sp. sptzw28]
MKVLITGAAGNLGRVLAPALAQQGHEPVLMDYRNIETPFRFINGDVTSKESVLKAVEGVDAVVHAAALHGIHLSKYTRDDFWKLNIEGTYNIIYEAARICGINKVLLCSTMGVYGESIKASKDSFAIVTEDLPLLPTDFYGYSKKLCEEAADFYSRNHGIKTIAYRLGMFVPENFLYYGFRLLKGGIDDRDVAEAFLAGLENDTIGFDAFNINIMADVPFPQEEFKQWRSEPDALLESYFPGVSQMVNLRGGNI